VMWRTTKDVKWREHGWAIWEAINKTTRTSSGYASIQDVSKSDPQKIDSMPRSVSCDPILSELVIASTAHIWVGLIP
jgi:mannosyl-oligosaccharide alpha-1,2-mannosidase